MGFFDFLKSKRSKALESLRKADYLFTTTDSFYRFTMGLRAWQRWQGHDGGLYRDEVKAYREPYLTEALSWWRECHEKYPRDRFPHFMLAMALVFDGSREEARALFTQLVQLDPDGDIGICSKQNIIVIDTGDHELALKTVPSYEAK